MMSDISVKQMAALFSVAPENLSLEDLASCSDYAPRPQLTIEPGELPRARRLVHKLLRNHARKQSTEASQRVYSRMGTLVHLSRNVIEPADVILDEDGKPVDKDYHVADEFLATPAENEWLAELVEIIACVVRPVKDGFVPRDLPTKIIVRLQAAKADWRFQELAGTVETPTLRQDGTLLDKPGYDRKSGLYFDPHGVKFPPIEAQPTKDQGECALKMLKRVLCDFPFADEDGVEGLSLSVALAGMLTAVIRRMLPTAPMFGIDANEVESGKTLLAQVFAIMMTGRRTGARPLSMEPYQQATALAAAYEASDPVLLFDNIDEPIHGAPLEAAITERSFTMRRLGGNSASDQVKAPTNSMLIGTGNKLRAAGDMAGNRLVISKIVPGQALSSRKFAHNPLDEYVIRMRPALVAAALTVLRAYIVAGYPLRNKLPTFRLKEWRDLVADALVWYGEADPCASAARVIDADPVREERLALLQALRKDFRFDVFTTNEALKGTELSKRVFEDVLPAQKSSQTKLATKFLEAMVGVRLGQYQLRKFAATSEHATKWRVQIIDDGAALDD